MSTNNKLSAINGGKPDPEEMCSICDSEWHNTLGCPYLESASFDPDDQTYTFTFINKCDSESELQIFEGCFPRLDEWRTRIAADGKEAGDE